MYLQDLEQIPSMDVIMQTYKILSQRINDIHANDGFTKRRSNSIWHNNDYYRIT